MLAHWHCLQIALRFVKRNVGKSARQSSGAGGAERRVPIAACRAWRSSARDHVTPAPAPAHAAGLHWLSDQHTSPAPPRQKCCELDFPPKLLSPPSCFGYVYRPSTSELPDSNCVFAQVFQNGQYQLIRPRWPVADVTDVSRRHTDNGGFITS